MILALDALSMFLQYFFMTETFISDGYADRRVVDGTSSRWRRGRVRNSSRN
jgi:hypothetical protein